MRMFTPNSSTSIGLDGLGKLGFAPTTSNPKTNLALLILNCVPRPCHMNHDEVCSYGHFSTSENSWGWLVDEVLRSPVPNLIKCAKTLGVY